MLVQFGGRCQQAIMQFISARRQNLLLWGCQSCHWIVLVILFRKLVSDWSKVHWMSSFGQPCDGSSAGHCKEFQFVFVMSNLHNLEGKLYLLVGLFSIELFDTCCLYWTTVLPFMNRARSQPLHNTTVLVSMEFIFIDLLYLILGKSAVVGTMMCYLFR